MRTEQVELPVSVRSGVGKSASRQLRAQGKIPAVVYGRGIAPLPVAVEEAVFSRSLPQANWFSTLISLRIGEAQKKDAEPTVMIKEVQLDLTRQQLLSIDFQRISMSDTINTQIPIVVVGQSPGVKQGGILEHLGHEVTVECLPTDIPDHFEADVSQAEIGDTLRVRDLTAPPGVKLLTPAEDVIVVIAPPVRVEEVTAPAAEEGALVEEPAEPEVIGERETSEEAG